MDPFNDLILVILQTYCFIIYDNQVLVVVILDNALDNPFR